MLCAERAATRDSEIGMSLERAVDHSSVKKGFFSPTFCFQDVTRTENKAAERMVTGVKTEYMPVSESAPATLETWCEW